MDTVLCYGCMEPTDQFICPHCGFPRNGNNQPHQLPVGSLLRGQYVIGKVLGQGGFGITYLGWDRYLDTKVAIKEFYPSAMVSRDCTHSTCVLCTGDQTSGPFRNSRERFLREAKALAKFEGNSAIVGIKSFFEENDTAYIIMEYVKGTSLERYVAIRGGRVSFDETTRLLQPVMDALAKVHDAGMVHRDISPDNIILHPMGGAKLLDFGAVRDVESPNADQALARSTEAILKHGFAPIEQYQSRGSLGPWTDVYALCATIWYCVTGRVPTDAPARIIEELPLAWDSVPGLTAHQQEVLRKGTALRAKDRYASVGALRQDLMRETAAPSPIVTVKETPAPQPKAPVTPAAPAASPTTDSNTWTCSTCGQKNKNWRSFCEKCNAHKPATPKASPSVGTTADGDWFCSCGQKNKVWHSSCQKCHAPKPAQPVKVPAPAPAPVPASAHDDTWTCSTCGQRNKNWRSFCEKCNALKPATPKASPSVGTTSDGDWYCGCGQKNKVWHSSCQKCHAPKPAQPKKTPLPRPTADGDWYCSCGQKNKVWHSTCHVCHAPKPTFR